MRMEVWGESLYIKDSGIKELLIEAGKQEFLLHGFKQASLRTICAKAGVTTGAVYSCFTNKEDLFVHIVGAVVDELKQKMQDSCITECQDSTQSLNNDISMIKFLWHNREVVQLLIECSQGTKYEGTFEEIEKKTIEYFAAFYKQYTGKVIDDALVSIIVRMRIQGLLEILKGGYSLEKSIELATNMSIYSNTGYQKLMELAGRD